MTSELVMPPTGLLRHLRRALPWDTQASAPLWGPCSPSSPDPSAPQPCVLGQGTVSHIFGHCLGTSVDPDLQPLHSPGQQPTNAQASILSLGAIGHP